jgi:hypothetical protein
MWIQIPTPGDHYSPAYGSALITIIYEISKIHQMNSGKTRVIVGKGTRHDHDCGEIVEVDFPLELSRNQKIVDYGLECIGAKRMFGPRQYAPALEAIPRDFDGVVFIHNNPVALRLIQSARPNAKVCL